MNYLEFCKKVPETIRAQVDPEANVEVRKVTKNNGVVLDGLTIMQPGINIAPTIYLEPYYDHYRKGMPFDLIVSDILEEHEKYRATMPIDPDAIMRFEAAKDRLRFRLVNRAGNREALKTVPFIPFLDLAVVFYFTIEIEGVHLASVSVSNELMEEWGMRIDRLLEIAYDNLLKYEPAGIRPMRETLEVLEEEIREREAANGSGSFASDPDDKLWEETGEETTAVPMYVLTNRSRSYGAACMLYQHVFEPLAEASGKDILIIPSSIHELILIPDLSCFNISELEEMVREVNSTQLLPYEVLSDRVYRYTRSTGKVAIAE